MYMTVSEAIEDAEEELFSWDCTPTNDNLIRCFITWIDNLYSHIGTSAHRHEIECGIIDNTGYVLGKARRTDVGTDFCL